MSEESFNSEAVSTAPDAEVTATSVVADTGSPGDAESQEPKTFTQDEVDSLVGERLAKAQRKWQREQARIAESEDRRAPTTPPDPDHFNDVDSYADALAVHKAAIIIAQREQQAQRSEIDSTYSEREEDARTKYKDFEQVAYNPDLRITPEMAEVIKASDLGPEIAYHLGSNPSEAARISHLSPLSQARELGRIEAGLGVTPTRRSSSAPDPITPIGSRSSAPSYNTSDPRSTKMSPSDWINQRNKELRSKG